MSDTGRLIARSPELGERAMGSPKFWKGKEAREGREEGRGKREEGRGRREEGRGRREEGRGEAGQIEPRRSKKTP